MVLANIGVREDCEIRTRMVSNRQEEDVREQGDRDKPYTGETFQAAGDNRLSFPIICLGISVLIVGRSLPRVGGFGTCVLLIFAMLMPIQCARHDSESILFDFESEKELDQFSWHCHTLFALSDKHATHGAQSLKLILFPSDYPGTTPEIILRNWRKYRSFVFDVYNQEERDVPLTVRIDDKQVGPDYGDRYNTTIILSPGPHRLILPLDQLIASGTRRRIDLDKVRHVFLFVQRPRAKTTLYLDYFRLTSE
jgi:hypothetical protein